MALGTLTIAFQACQTSSGTCTLAFPRCASAFGRSGCNRSANASLVNAKVQTWNFVNPFSLPM
jgi:hypothetical protein